MEEQSSALNEKLTICGWKIRHNFSTKIIMKRDDDERQRLLNSNGNSRANNNAAGYNTSQNHMYIQQMVRLLSCMCSYIIHFHMSHTHIT